MSLSIRRVVLGEAQLRVLVGELEEARRRVGALLPDTVTS